MFDSGLKGTAAEKLVEFDLLLQGIETFTPSAIGGNYDLLATVGTRVYRVQVKSGAVKGNRMMVDVRRSSHARTTRHYSENGYDVLAIVNIQDRRVAYVRKADMTARSSINVWLDDNIPTKGRHPNYAPFRFNEHLAFPSDNLAI